MSEWAIGLALFSPAIGGIVLVAGVIISYWKRRKDSKERRKKLLYIYQVLGKDKYDDFVNILKEARCDIDILINNTYESYFEKYGELKS